MYPPSPRKQLTWQWKHVTLEDVSPIKIMWFYIVMLVFGVVFFLLKQKPLHQWFATHTQTQVSGEASERMERFPIWNTAAYMFFFLKGHLCGGCFLCLINLMGFLLNICRLSHLGFSTCVKRQVSTLWNIRWQYAKRAALCKDRVGIPNKHKKRFQRITAWSTFVWTYTTNSHEKTFPLFHLAHDILRWCNLN